MGEDKTIHACKVVATIEIDTDDTETKLDKIEQQIDRIKNKYSDLYKIINSSESEKEDLINFINNEK